MADNTRKDSRIEKPSTAITPPEKPAVQKTELPQEIKHIKEEERAVKEETTAGTSGLKLERLETAIVGPDKDTPEMILSIDVNRESTEQSEKLNRLELVNLTLLPKLFAAGFKKEMLQAFENLRSIHIDE